MALVSIDKEICTGCGSCVEICPYRALKLIDTSAEYVLGSCFLCGHCFAICPVKAVRIPSLSPTEGLGSIRNCEKGSRRQVLPLDLFELMRTRRSCRNYTAEPTDLQILKDLVKIGTTAPSGTNSQSWNFMILPSRDDVKELGGMVGDYFRKLNRQAESRLLRLFVKVFGNDALGRYYRNHYTSVSEALKEWDSKGNDRLFHGATSAILVTGKRGASCPGEDALLATQNILLSAHSMGIGTCLIGFVVEAMKRDASISRRMEMPEDEQVYAVIALGHPAVTFLRPVGRKEVVPRLVRFNLGK